MTGWATIVSVAVKVLCLGTMVGTAAALTPVLAAGERYLFLAAVWAVVAVVLATYATRRAMLAKYLVPGTLLLILFIVTPVLATLQLSTTNYGDGTRTSKEQTIARILGNSVVQAENSPEFNLSVATTGRPATGPYTFFLVDRATGEVYSGTEDGLERLTPGSVTLTGQFVTAAPGYTVLTPQQVNDAAPRLREFTVPTGDGAIRQRGLREAFEGRTALRYDEASDTITDTRTGVRYTAQRQGDREYFAGPDGTRLADQSWRADVGLDNYRRAFTDPRILGGFLRIFTWTVVFATGSVVLTFVVGLALAVMLNDPRVRGQKLYRSILLLPYAIPGFISILVWSGFYNQEFGLINSLTGLNVDWLGDPIWAKAALLLMNLWLGFPYMFLVTTGALQAIPADLKEAASIDGANGFTGFRTVTFPLLLVAVAPILVATFAFNFNNYNVIELLTHGGPFTPDNPNAGATDILISYTVRLAFGAGGAQFGFASAIATLLFVITGVLAAAQFRATRRLEEVN
jgi:arabinogalactan oligomer / maltooligosaccharide transport system permease protein